MRLLERDTCLEPSDYFVSAPLGDRSFKNLVERKGVVGEGRVGNIAAATLNKGGGVGLKRFRKHEAYIQLQHFEARPTVALQHFEA